jgi:xanthine/CO dehydrogenase XdhC/CoxF family maturation factor
MKEFQSIICAYEKAKSNHLKTALATVVQVDGSAYRRPGARMLVTETGELTGTISGGCLEGDALRKAQAVIFQQQSMLVTYDTTDENDQKFGIGLGCNGIIQILIEPIDPEKEFNPIELLKKATQDRNESVLVTAFSLKHSKSAQIGTVLIWKHGNPIENQSSLDGKLFGTIVDELKNFELNSNTICTYPQHDQINVFYETIIKKD